MGLGTRLRAALLRLTARRHRRILTASLGTVLISATLLGFIEFLRWRGHEAVQSDTKVSIAQTGRQLLRSLQSRRGTLTFLRDTLNRRPTLSDSQLAALGASAVDHTRHLLGVGLAAAGQSPAWWAGPRSLSGPERAQLNRAIGQRRALPRAWRVPGTFVVMLTARRALLVMVEPLKASGAIIGAFDATALLEDFFASTLSSPQAVQLLAGDVVLYRSSTWQPDAEARHTGMEEQPVAIDAARWLLQMQPPSTHIVQTLSWLSVSVIALGGLVGLGLVAVIWILAARTWILQRAVAKRTAALRQALQRVRQLAITDELTGLYNRRFFLKRWAWECDRAKRYGRPLACLMVDVNEFKQVNDRLGHQAGDLVLKQVAQELKTLLRDSDILARLGGDEFVVALPETTPGQAAQVVDKLRELCIRLPEAAARAVVPISLSVGMSPAIEATESPQAMLEAADQSLYDEKRRRSSPPRTTR